ncbi:type II secretion system protein GspL [Alteromonas oceanisediminis]|uniref:type II secretion system protein GspL n=1 Tax=Alteromonas oceanisediminis TaxID=2836180 RepID=UPI001BDA6CEE|nr:type II secretion system protein GspL [Alteromonas oceanisediminis]MBT0587860.1 type II secretion system protein GspL [Alteromonas oceanisediminis]
MEQLIVRLGSDHHQPVHWIVWSQSEQEIIASGELPNADALSSLSERAGERPIIALAPTSDILLKWVTLPPRAGRKVIAAIPYMLEDELSTDVSEQFFAIGPKRGNEQAVAIVARAQMERWKSMLSNADLSCEKLLPDVLALPVNEQGWSLLSLGTNWLIRQDEWSGMQGEPDWLMPAISHYAKQQETPLTIHDYSGLEIVVPPNVDWQPQTLELPMHVLVKGCEDASFNLLQGDFKVKKQRNSQWRQWRLAAILAVVALTLSLVDRVITLTTLNAQQETLAAQIDAEIKRGFPDIGGYRDVKRGVGSELAKLEQGGGKVSMLVMLNQLASAFDQTNVKPQSIRYDGERGELRMQAAATDFEALERFRNLAQAAGYTVEQGAINNRDDQVIGSIAIRG